MLIKVGEVGFTNLKVRTLCCITAHIVPIIKLYFVHFLFYEYIYRFLRLVEWRVLLSILAWQSLLSSYTYRQIEIASYSFYSSDIKITKFRVLSFVIIHHV